MKAPPAVPSWRRRAAALALLFALAAPAAAGAPAEPAAEAEMAELLALLAEETELATRSKQNADYVPGIVNVLHAEEARLLGARTALEALTQVPGIEVNRDQFGSPALRVRGVDFFFNGGNVKVLVDGLPISREAAFQNGAVLLMPIEQLDRIELIRGPGTGVHGDFAYMGLVNLVTRHDGNGVGVSVGRGQRRSLLARFASGTGAAATAPRLSGNASRWSSERYDTSDGLDNDEDRRLLNLQLDWQGLSFQLAALDRDWQGLVRVAGRAGQPPPSNPLRLNRQQERSHSAELRYRWRPSEDQGGAVWLQRQDNDYLRPGNEFSGPRSELGAEWTAAVGAHRWLARAQWAQLEIERAFGAPGAPPPIRDDRRDMHSLTLQDQWQLGEDLQLTAGLRYDRIEGIDSATTPRLAAVWQLAEHHLLKAQYAEGFRSPTVGDRLDAGRRPFEQVATRELAYIYRRPNTVLRVSGFSNRISPLLFPPQHPLAGTSASIEAQGLEFEWSYQPRSWMKLQATWSTANAADARAAVVPVPGQPPSGFGGPSLSQPEALGNLSLLFTPAGAWSGGLHWQHVGRRADRGQAGFQPGYQTLNLGLSYRPPRLPRLRLDWGLRNALEDQVFYIETQGPGMPLQFNRYHDREWSFGISWSFD